MTKVLQYIHYPNNTELGKGNTNETYMLVPLSIDASELFPFNEEVDFIEPSTSQTYKIKAKGDEKEFRVNQMGEFYRANQARFGDVVSGTMISNNNDSIRFISIIKQKCLGLFGNSKKGYELLNSELIEQLGFSPRTKTPFKLRLMYNGQECLISISYKESKKKRKDSPIETDFYNVNCTEIELGGKLIANLETNDLIELNKSYYNVIYW